MYYKPTASQGVQGESATTAVFFCVLGGDRYDRGSLLLLHHTEDTDAHANQNDRGNYDNTDEHRPACVRTEGKM